MGPEITFLSHDAYEASIERVPEEEARAYVHRLTRAYRTFGAIDDEKLYRSARASLGLAGLAKEYELDVLVLNDVDMELHRKFGLRPGFYPPWFDETRCVLVPEGDIATGTILFAVRIMTGNHVSFVEPMYIHAEGNSFMAGHGSSHDYLDDGMPATC